MANYHPITAEEMEAFLTPQGFKPLAVEGTKEAVYAAVRRVATMVYSLRVYSSLVAGEAREVGADAIRLEVYWRTPADDANGIPAGPPVRIGGSKRVHRVKGWRDNLAQRIAQWEAQLGPACPQCGAPTVGMKSGKGHRCARGKVKKVGDQWVTEGCPGVVWNK